MADTHFIKTLIEPAVREMLAERYGQAFQSRSLPVGMKLDGSERLHEFDAVSEDLSIVAAIKSSSGTTSGGNRPAGKIAAAYKEIYFLERADAPKKLMVFTGPEFHAIMSDEFRGIMPPKTALLHLPLPRHLQEQLDELKGRTD